MSETQLEHNIVWTACPNGVAAGGKLRLSVCAGHQLGLQGPANANNPEVLTALNRHCGSMTLIQKP